MNGNDLTAAPSVMELTEPTLFFCRVLRLARRHVNQCQSEGRMPRPGENNDAAILLIRIVIESGTMSVTRHRHDVGVSVRPILFRTCGL